MARADKLPQRPPFVYLSPPFRFSLINAPLLNAFDGRPHHELDPPTSPLPCRLLLCLPRRSIKRQHCATLHPLLLRPCSHPCVAAACCPRPSAAPESKRPRPQAPRGQASRPPLLLVVGAYLAAVRCPSPFSKLPSSSAARENLSVLPSISSVRCTTRRRPRCPCASLGPGQPPAPLSKASTRLL